MKKILTILLLFVSYFANSQTIKKEYSPVYFQEWVKIKKYLSVADTISCDSLYICSTDTCMWISPYTIDNIKPDSTLYATIWKVRQIVHDSANSSGAHIRIGADKSINLGDAATSDATTINIDGSVADNDMFTIGTTNSFMLISGTSNSINLTQKTGSLSYAEAIFDVSGSKLIGYSPSRSKAFEIQADSSQCAILRSAAPSDSVPLKFINNATTSAIIWAKGNELYFKNNSGTTKTLTELASGGGAIDTTKTPLIGHYGTQYDLSLKQAILTNPVTTPNAGISGYLPHYTGAGTIDTSKLYYDATKSYLGVNNTVPVYPIDFSGNDIRKVPNYIALRNNTASTSGQIEQWSPHILFKGSSYTTGSPSVIHWLRMGMQPLVSGGTSLNKFAIDISTDSTIWTNIIRYSNNIMNVAGGLAVGASLSFGGGSGTSMTVTQSNVSSQSIITTPSMSFICGATAISNATVSVQNQYSPYVAAISKVWDGSASKSTYWGFMNKTRLSGGATYQGDCVWSYSRDGGTTITDYLTFQGGTGNIIVHDTLKSNELKSNTNTFKIIDNYNKMRMQLDSTKWAFYYNTDSLFRIKKDTVYSHKVFKPISVWSTGAVNASYFQMIYGGMSTTLQTTASGLGITNNAGTAFPITMSSGGYGNTILRSGLGTTNVFSVNRNFDANTNTVTGYIIDVVDNPTNVTGTIGGGILKAQVGSRTYVTDINPRATYNHYSFGSYRDLVDTTTLFRLRDSVTTVLKVDAKGYIHADNPHAVSQFMDSTIVIALTQDVWVQITGTTKQTWPATEFIGFAESGDTIISSYTGDFNLAYEVNLLGVSSKDYEYRMLRKRGATSTVIWAYKITSSGNAVLRSIRSYLEDVLPNDRYWIETRSTSVSPGNITIYGGRMICTTQHLD